MPIVGGIFSNRYQEQEDYEYLYGAESFPYVILRETEKEQSIPVVTEKPKQQVSFFKKLLGMIKFPNFPFQGFTSPKK